MIYGGLPGGTRLEVVQVLRWDSGDNGKFWIAYAVIQDGEFAGRRVLLPWDGSGDFPWITTAPGELPSRADPIVNARVLTSCASDIVHATP